MNRKQKQLYRQSVDMFIDMLETITKRKCNYRCNDSDVGSFETFCNEFDTNIISMSFIKTYLEYQFQSWFNTGTDKDYSRTVRFSWMFGAKAIKRWRVFKPEVNVKIVRGHIKKLGIYKPKVSRETKIPELILRIRPAEENFKREYHNTQRGFAWCIANTTLYNHKSSLCVRCSFKNECKEVLEKQYPKVYVKRGYGKK